MADALSPASSDGSTTEAVNTGGDDNSQGRVTGNSAGSFKTRIERCKSKRREFLRDWRINVDFRRGKATDTDWDDNRSPVTVDWSQTNAKIAQLFSQLPTVILSADGPYKPAAMPAQKRLNWRMQKAKVGACMDEVLPDVLNAAGIGVAMVSYESRSVMKMVPVEDVEDMGPVDQLLVKLKLKKIPMENRPFVVDRMFKVERVGPEDFLWPVEFEKSDFDESPWVGRSGRMNWGDALNVFKPDPEKGNRGITEDDREEVLGDNRTMQDRLNSDTREDRTRDQEVVSYDEIFYWRYLYHEDEKYFSAIQRMVFVEGIKEPIIDEAWSGQQFDEETNTYTGACKFPIRVLTLHYVSSECIPPSESAVTRPTVKELMRGREQIMSQRDHSKPIRWVDSNRIDADILTLLMQGDWQGFIPTQGAGDKAIGEIARASYPQEDMAFDREFKQDLMEARSLGPNQVGVPASGPRSAAETKITQQNFGTVISQQRARCTAFLVGIAEVLFGLMALYDDWELPDQKDQQNLQNWDRTRINQELAFSVRLDSSVLLDSDQRIDRIMRFLNMMGKSGRVNIDYIGNELAALSTLDPDQAMTPPAPPKQEKPSIGFSFKGAEDMNDPAVVAILMGNDQLPGPEMLDAAKKYIMQAKTPLQPQPPQQPQGPGGAQPPAPGGPQPQPPMSDEHPDWQAVDRINSRRDATQE